MSFKFMIREMLSVNKKSPAAKLIGSQGDVYYFVYDRMKVSYYGNYKDCCILSSPETKPPGT